MWSPVDAQCQPDLGTAYWAAKAQHLGARTAYNVKAARRHDCRSRMGIQDRTTGTLATDALVVAAGVWTPYLTRTVGIDVPIMPVVMSELETEPVTLLFKAALRAFGFGARQRPSGQLVVSAGLNAQVWHVSLADLHGLRWWAARWGLAKVSD